MSRSWGSSSRNCLNELQYKNSDINVNKTKQFLGHGTANASYWNIVLCVPSEFLWGGKRSFFFFFCCKLSHFQWSGSSTQRQHANNLNGSRTAAGRRRKQLHSPAGYDIDLQLLPVEGRQSTQSTVGCHIGRGEELSTGTEQKINTRHQPLHALWHHDKQPKYMHAT